MGKILELIKSFINPIEQEESFDKLAVASGLLPSDMEKLKKSMNGVDWKFDGGDKEIKKTGKSEKNSSKVIIQEPSKITVEKKEKGFEIGD